MSSAQIASAAAPSTAPGVGGGDSSPTVRVGVESLVVGRQLKCPIFDQGGLLLLAECSIITPRFKQLLLSRGVCDVLLSQVDADGMSDPLTKSNGSHEAAHPDSDITHQLEELIVSGRLFSDETGHRIRNRIVLHGHKGFSAERREAVFKQHAAASAALDDIVQDALGGQPVDGDRISRVVATYLTNLTSDANCLRAIVRLAGRYAALAEHCLQMSMLGMSLGIEMGLAAADVRIIGLSGLLHDFGMGRVPREICEANRLLTREEFREIQKHPIYTLELLQSLPGIPNLVPLICYQIHERPNGTGYPRGRRGKSIHPFARILNVADAYLALTKPRSFRKPLMPYAAIECLLRHSAEKLVDGDVVRALLHVLSLFPTGSHVKLSDGRLARVLRRNGNDYSSPIVQIINDTDGNPGDAFDETLIMDPSQQNLKIVQVVPGPAEQGTGLTPQVVKLNRS